MMADGEEIRAILPVWKFLINKTIEKPISSGKLHQPQSERRSYPENSVNNTIFSEVTSRMRANPGYKSPLNSRSAYI
jgi:hypothetical protein